MRERFNRQLSQLNAELITMGALCEDAIASAVKYFTEGDENMKNYCIESDKQIDRKERDIETLCIKLILQQQPVATDLRVVSAALKMISDMERIGDQAGIIAEISEYVTKDYLGNNTHIIEMARATIKMVTDSIESFVKNNMDLAKAVIEHDNIVDELFYKVKSEVIEAISNGDSNAESLLDLLMIAKYFERIGDHAENIAEWVIYSITGKHIDTK